ncbi:uncharacterized protein LOC8073427 isoform X5 [Sorghum bicolor]|uniref:uncharacterized protein LOC8073427 isoform X5 n=1 Tax=Sorghum bicolor TaxID=4558 RepID=UPI000B425FE8|nr:uncharacterized protein LOC8073427 isoform X5 [Sorghum bicolor]|eukprot:XP_021318537.1 uncharacterized protein LOC8073427 isoform X5 [Sorghum bicolor]
MGQEFTRGPSGPSPISVPSRHERGHAAEAALRPQRRRPAGQSQARRRRQQLLLPPLASRLAPSLPSSAHRPATLLPRVGSEMDEAADSSELLRRVEELQREKDEKQNSLEVLLRRVEGLQYEMDEKVDLVEVLTRRVEDLQRGKKRDALRKDIEQLCMQQAGPGYVSVATRMLTQRTAALEQDIENLQKKLGGCLRENQNLQEELAEAYRIKSQLAELHGAALSKCEKAKEREEAVSRKFADFEERMREYQLAIDEQKHLNDDLQRELTELKAHTELSLKVILKFYDLRCRDSECSSSVTFEEKCSILLDDCADNWSFCSDGGTSTLKYIASLEAEKESLKAKISKLQSNLRMGLEIEQHLQRNARILEKRQALYDGFLRNGLSELQKFYTYQKAEIMKILEEESSQLIKVVAGIQDKLTEICINTEVNEHPANEIQCCDSSCKDVHVTTDISPSTCPKSDSPADLNSVSFDESKALAQALQEKMEALMLFSQEQERYLLEKQRDLIVIEELQKNLSQVKDEKVKILMELAKLKEQYLLLQGSSAVKEGHDTGDSSKVIPGQHDQQGMLKTMLKRTSLRHWMRKESSTIGHGSSDGNDHTVCKEHSVDVARLRVENAMLLEGVGTVERLTSSVRRLHIVLLKAYDDIKSADSLESTFEALNSLITEANLMKTALNVVLPVSWSGDSSDAITYEALCDPSDSPKSKSWKVDPLSSAGMEMVELLILAAEILKESFLVKK